MGQIVKRKGIENMWKLIITQKRKSEYSEYMNTDSCEFISDDINELTMLVVRMAGFKTAIETAYKIEKVGGENE